MPKRQRAIGAGDASARGIRFESHAPTGWAWSDRGRCKNRSAYFVAGLDERIQLLGPRRLSVGLDSVAQVSDMRQGEQDVGAATFGPAAGAA